jgi:hypothetical protein
LSKQKKFREGNTQDIEVVLTSEAATLRRYTLKDCLLASRLGSYVIAQRSFGSVKPLSKIFDTSSVSLGLVGLCLRINSIRLSLFASLFTLF